MASPRTEDLHPYLTNAYRKNPKLFKDFAAIMCRDQNIDWGGSWKSFKDTPHFGFTWKWQLQANNLY